MYSGLIKRLLAGIKCDECGRHYKVANIDVLGRQDDLWFLTVFCSNCSTQYLIVAVVKESKVTEVVTDLTEAELSKYRTMGKVTVDDLIGMHIFLKGFDGDFVRLFRQE